MSTIDIGMLLDSRNSVEGLRNYFSLRPRPTRRELAQVKPLIKQRRYRLDVDVALLQQVFQP